MFVWLQMKLPVLFFLKPILGKMSPPQTYFTSTKFYVKIINISSGVPNSRGDHLKINSHWLS